MTTLDLVDLGAIAFIVIMVNLVSWIGLKLYLDNMMSEIVDFLQKRLQTFRATLVKSGKQITRQPESIDWVNTGIEGIKTLVKMRKEGVSASDIVKDALKIQDAFTEDSELSEE